VDYISWVYQVDAGYIAAALLLAMIGSTWFGLRVGAAALQPGADSGTLAVSFLGLLGLLLAFTFSMAGARYDEHRDLFVSEANAISTVAMRADMYLEPDRSALRRDLRGYLEARIHDAQVRFDDPRQVTAERARRQCEERLWRRVAAAAREPGNLVASQQMVPALGLMFDFATQRRYLELTHVPVEILLLLFVACVLGAFYAAYFACRASHFDWSATFGFSLLCAAVVYVVLDLERPQRGLIDMRINEHALIEVWPLLRGP
jgi:hypothetical protein